YSYNDVLFMSINTNNLSTAEHQAFLTSGIAAYKEQNGGKDPLWKIVILHHSIYSTAGHAVNADIIQRRNELSPIFNNLGIDAVLMGHDH
ncbi:metallophosphoesterase, partial [Bacillus cereus]|nr:metallophosphoesterase [Bacillus cereus]